MQTETLLTDADQIAAMHGALRLLDIGHVESAHILLLETLEETPQHSRCWPALTQAANCIHPCGSPKEALRVLATSLLRLEQQVEPKMTAAEHGAFPGGRWK